MAADQMCAPYPPTLRVPIPSLKQPPSQRQDANPRCRVKEPLWARGAVLVGAMGEGGVTQLPGGEWQGLGGLNGENGGVEEGCDGI